MVNRTVSAAITLAAYDNVVARRLPRKLLRKPRQRLGRADRHEPRTPRKRHLAPGRVPVGPQYSPAQTPIQRALGPGEAERIGTLVPPNAKPGLYKLNLAGTVLDSGEPVALSAEFGVL